MENKLNYKRTFFIGLAFMSLSAFWTFYDQAVPVILESIFGVETTLTNMIMAIDNVLALFMLSLFGTLSDKTNTPFGRRTPFIVLGTVSAVICFWGMALGLQLQSFWLYFVMLFLTLVAMSTYRSPAVALMPDLTPRQHRSSANAIINLMGVVGGAFSLVAVMLLVKSGKTPEGATTYENQNFWPVFLAIGGFMLVTVGIFVLTIRERRLKEKLTAEGVLSNREDEEEDNGSDKGKGTRLPKPVLKSLIFILLAVACWYIAYNGITTNLSRYCQYVLGKDLSASSTFVLVTLIVSTIAFLPLGILSARLGRKKMILCGVGLMGVCVACASFITKDTPAILMYILFAGVGIGWAAINVNSYPMVVEISSNGDIGRYTGYYYTFSMAAQVVTPLLTGLLIDPNILNLGYTVLFPYATVFMALAFVCMLMVRHGDARPAAKKSLLENFDTPED